MRSDLDAPFRHYTLRHKVIAWISRKMFDRVTYTVRHGLLKGMKRRGGLGWVPAWIVGQESKESHFWRSVNLAGKVVYDIGAFHGLLTLYFSRRAARVVSFEPNGANVKRLIENLRVNHVRNVTVRQVGIGSLPGRAVMASSFLMPGGSTIDPIGLEHLRRSKDIELEEIAVSTIDEEVFGGALPAPDVLKIDIEGLELEALKGGKRTLNEYRPALYMEMHGQTVKEKERKVHDLVNHLYSIGYTDVFHVESGAPITPENSQIARRGHLYCPSHIDIRSKAVSSRS
jgi:FkbM family methyltransferase